MLSLISTFFIGLCCCGGLANYGLSGASKDSNFIMNSNDSLVYDDYRNSSVSKETKPIQNFGVFDEYGIQLYLYQSDLLSYQFIENFMWGVARFYDNAILPSESNYTINFENLSSEFYLYDYATATYTFSHTIDKIEFRRQYYYTRVVEGDDVLVFDYYLKFYDTDTQIFAVEYHCNSPMKGNFAHDLGFQVAYITMQGIAYNQGFCLKENDLGGFCPFIQYFLGELNYQEVRYIDSGYKSGYGVGYSVGKEEGYTQGNQEGYAIGLADGSSYDSVALSIFTGILQVGLLPVNVFLQILNFEVFGINISGFVSAFLTISILVIVIRIIIGSKNND